MSRELAGVCAVLLASAAGAAAPSPRAVETAAFSVSVPAGWSAEIQDPAGKVLLTRPGRGPRASILLRRMDPKKADHPTAADYVAKILNPGDEIGPDPRVSRGPERRVAGLRAFSLLYAASSPRVDAGGSAPMWGETIAVQAATGYFLIGLDGPAAGRTRDSAAMREVLASFRPTP